MRSSIARPRLAASFRLNREDANCAKFRWLSPFLAVAMLLATPSAGSAQTLDLGQAGDFGVFAVSDPISGNTGDFNFSQVNRRRKCRSRCKYVSGGSGNNSRESLPGSDRVVFGRQRLGEHQFQQQFGSLSLPAWPDRDEYRDDGSGLESR